VTGDFKFAITDIERQPCWRKPRSICAPRTAPPPGRNKSGNQKGRTLVRISPRDRTRVLRGREKPADACV